MKYDFFMSPVHGIGCIATEDIKTGDIVAKEPYTITKVEYREFQDYYWSSKEIGKNILINGLGNYCNHNNNNNIIPILKITDEPFITFIATQNIKKGEEIFNNYGKNWWNSRKIEKKRFSLFRF